MEKPAKKVFITVIFLILLVSLHLAVYADDTDLQQADEAVSDYDDTEAMLTGWQKSDGSWYYINDEGKTTVGWKRIDGKWYYFHSSGKMAKGWLKLSATWYYLRPDGSMATGWIKYNNSWYYLKSSGAMAAGWLKIDGKWYYFTSAGVACRNKWVQSGLQWYYLGNNWSMVSGTTIRIGETAYKFDSKGRWVCPLQQNLEKTKTSKQTSQLILVVNHNLTFWEKDSSGLWVKKMDIYCGYGQKGFVSGSSRKEGSKTTPIGSYPITLAFGTGSNPGTSMKYRQITSYSYWSSAKNSSYNTWVESKTPIVGEHLINCSVYKYALAIGFNTNPVVYGRGSAIFLHCKKADHWYTDGCISIEKNRMLSLMKSLKNGAYIIIVPNAASVTSY